MGNLIVHGLYSVKDKYFEDFKRPYWMDNKNEKRPYYLLLQDKDDIYWVVPMSSQTENYKMKIEREEAKRGKGELYLLPHWNDCLDREGFPYRRYVSSR